MHSVAPGGFIQQWNTQYPLSQITEGCVITRVNDVDGIPSEMVREMIKNEACMVYFEISAQTLPKAAPHFVAPR